MALRCARRFVLLALAVALAAPATASAQISAPAAAEAREQGFDARETLGPRWRSIRAALGKACSA